MNVWLVTKETCLANFSGKQFYLLISSSMKLASYLTWNLPKCIDLTESTRCTYPFFKPALTILSVVHAAVTTLSSTTTFLKIGSQHQVLSR